MFTEHRDKALLCFPTVQLQKYFQIYLKVAKTNCPGLRGERKYKATNTGGANSSSDQRQGLLSFVLWTGMPCQSLLIKRYYHLRAAFVGLTGWDQIRFIRVFPEKTGKGGGKRSGKTRDIKDILGGRVHKVCTKHI